MLQHKSGIKTAMIATLLIPKVQAYKLINYTVVIILQTNQGSVSVQ